MGFGHEKSDVYRTSIEYVGWACRFCETLMGHRNAKDYLLLDRIVAMRTKLGQRGGTVREDQPQHTVGIDPDPDSDPDTDGNQKQTDRPKR
jgi:hypothetical protein